MIGIARRSFLTTAQPTRPLTVFAMHRITSHRQLFAKPRAWSRRDQMFIDSSPGIGSSLQRSEMYVSPHSPWQYIALRWSANEYSVGGAYIHLAPLEPDHRCLARCADEMC